VARIRLALQRADGEIRAFRGPDKAGAGTTIAGIALVDEGEGPQWAVFHIGDSRVYRWHEGRLELCTKDHSVVQELIDAGHISDASAGTHPQRHIITRAMGVSGRNDPDVLLLPVVPGDSFLVCTDGLTGELGDQAIAELLGTAAEPAAVAETATSRAVALGALDNVTTVVVEVGRTAEAPAAR
jgi:serine/threonine protein phosphatase PrpC